MAPSWSNYFKGNVASTEMVHPTDATISVTLQGPADGWPTYGHVSNLRVDARPQTIPAVLPGLAVTSVDGKDHPEVDMVADVTSIPVHTRAVLASLSKIGAIVHLQASYIKTITTAGGDRRHFVKILDVLAPNSIASVTYGSLGHVKEVQDQAIALLFPPSTIRAQTVIDKLVNHGRSVRTTIMAIQAECLAATSSIPSTTLSVPVLEEFYHREASGALMQTISGIDEQGRAVTWESRDALPFEMHAFKMAHRLTGSSSIWSEGMLAWSDGEPVTKLPSDALMAIRRWDKANLQIWQRALHEGTIGAFTRSQIDTVLSYFATDALQEVQVLQYFVTGSNPEYEPFIMV